MAQLKEEFSKYRENALMKVSRVQAQAKDGERKVAGVPEEIAAVRTMALSKY